MMRKKYSTIGCALLLALAAMGAQAGIIASATRVIFREGDTEKTLMLLNTNGYPIVAQTWVDNGDVNAAPSCRARRLSPCPAYSPCRLRR